MELFDRRCAVQVDTLRIEGLDVSFTIQKSLAAKTPNSAEIEIWNLNEDHRKQLQELERVYVDLQAGYAGGMSLLFRGDLRNVVSRRDGPDWITSVSSGSGQHGRKRRVKKSFAPKATVKEVLQAAAEAMGVKLGNSAATFVAASIKGTAARSFFNGYTMAGSAEQELDRLVRSCGLRWSVQDDELQIIESGKALQDEAIYLSPSTGLIGSPEIGNRGIVNVRSLMIPDAFPGRRALLESRHINGVHRIETTRHLGGTHETDWFIDYEMKAAA
jgi:hypothetical protein